MGELFQTAVTHLFPEITSAIVNACPGEGVWKEAQDSVISSTRIAIDVMFGVGGAASLVGLMGIFGGRES